MIAAIYGRKSTEQNGLADESKSVARQVEHARAFADPRGAGRGALLYVLGMTCGDCGREFRNEMALPGHRRACPPRRAASEQATEHRELPAQIVGAVEQLAQPAGELPEPAAEHAHDPQRQAPFSAETGKLLCATHEDLQELRAAAQQETDGLDVDQLNRWLPILVRVSRCADAVERMVVRGRVVSEQGREAYLEAVKLQAEWPTTLGKVNPDRWKETEEYDRGLLNCERSARRLATTRWQCGLIRPPSKV